MPDANLLTHLLTSSHAILSKKRFFFLTPREKRGWGVDKVAFQSAINCYIKPKHSLPNVPAPLLSEVSASPSYQLDFLMLRVGDTLDSEDWRY